jgi:hypothetical protein
MTRCCDSQASEWPSSSVPIAVPLFHVWPIEDYPNPHGGADNKQADNRKRDDRLLIHLLISRCDVSDRTRIHEALPSAFAVQDR